MINPYLNRGMLRNEGDFYGREEEIHNIYMRITQKTPQSCSVVGPRRIGKSSLLYHLSKKRGRFSNYLADSDNVYCVFYDLQSERGITIQRFFGKLRRKIIQAIVDNISVGEVESESEEEAFETLVEQVSEEGYSLVFFFDEFESITQNQNFDEQFFSQLRHIANEYNVAFVTSSQEDLSKLCHTDIIANPPFFNIFTKMHLQLLKEKEAIALVRNPAETEGIYFTDQEVKLVFELAGYHPFFIQITCSHLFELKRLKDQTILSRADFAHIRERFLVEASDHFDYCLRHLDDREWSALHTIAILPSFDPVASGLVPEVEALKRRGFIIQLGDHFSPFSSSFREFLQGLPAVSTIDSGQAVTVTHKVEQLVNTPDEGDYDGKVWDITISLERRLRSLLKQRFEDQWGINWEQQLEKRYEDIYQSWRKKQQGDAQTFRFYERTDVIFDYAYLGELGKLNSNQYETRSFS